MLKTIYCFGQGIIFINRLKAFVEKSGIPAVGLF
jgi:hypothetical protein